ncbi:MAG TPA: hypothetical protein VEJ38_11625 [Candidatus Acidoferrales bacterium]|nr:hypothetical protein [Candidatus Acidoferrales bacterium]
MLKNLALLIAGLVIGGAAVYAWEAHATAAPRFSTPYQAVLLDTGQVYYGKIEGLGTDFPVLRDVYYIQSVTDPQTKQVTNVLVRRGKEWHGPEYTVLNARHIAMIEPVSPSSKVATLIAQANQ